MAVALVLWGQIVVFTIDDPAELLGCSRAVVDPALKADFPVRAQYMLRETLVKPRSVSVHEFPLPSEQMPTQAEEREHAMLQYFITHLCQTGMSGLEVEIHDTGQLACQPLQPGQDSVFIGEYVDVQPAVFHALQSLPVSGVFFFRTYMFTLRITQTGPRLQITGVGTVVL